MRDGLIMITGTVTAAVLLGAWVMTTKGPDIATYEWTNGCEEKIDVFTPSADFTLDPGETFPNRIHRGMLDAEIILHRKGTTDPQRTTYRKSLTTPPFACLRVHLRKPG